MREAGPRIPYGPLGRHARTSAIILLLLPPGLAGFMAAVTPRYFSPLIATEVGRIVLLIMAVLYGLAVVSIRWIVLRVEAHRMRPQVASLLIALPMLLFLFPVVWLILLAPGLVSILDG